MGVLDKSKIALTAATFALMGAALWAGDPFVAAFAAFLFRGALEDMVGVVLRVRQRRRANKSALLRVEGRK